MNKLITPALLFILTLLMVNIPQIGQYEPFFKPSIETPGIWLIDITKDPHYSFRLDVMLISFLVTIIAAGLAFYSFIVRKDHPISLLDFTLFLLIFSIGWRAYPYWVNGLQYVQPEMVYDPKALLPMTIFGELWRFPVFLFYPLC